MAPYTRGRSRGSVTTIHASAGNVGSVGVVVACRRASVAYRGTVISDRRTVAADRGTKEAGIGRGVFIDGHADVFLGRLQLIERNCRSRFREVGAEREQLENGREHETH